MTEMNEVSQMGEASEMSVEESSLQATGDGKEDQGKGDNRKRLILIAGGILVLLVIAGVAVTVFGSQGSDSDSDGDGDDDDNFDPPSGSADSSAPSSVPSSATDEATGAPVKPPLNPKILICTANPTSDAAMPSVPDGLCDFLMYRPLSNPFTSASHEELREFIAITSKLNSTRCGIDIRQEIRKDVISQFDKHSNTSMAYCPTDDLYVENVQHYSTLDLDFGNATSDAEVQEFTSLLLKIRMCQERARGTSDRFGYLFLGVSPLAHNVTDADAALKNMASHFQRLLDDVKPDAVLFLTTYLRTHLLDPQCSTTGPSLWTRAIMYDQPTFNDSLNFRNMLKIPPDVVQLLSLTVHGRWSMYTEKTRPPGGMRNCNETIIGDILNYTCVNSTDDRYRQYRNADAQDRVDPVRITRVMRSSYTYWEGAYDSWATMQMKMCKACHDSTHRGGWVVFDLQYADVHNICNTDFVQGFGYVRRIKDYMLKPMTECVINETVDIVERGIRQEWLLPPS